MSYARKKRNLEHANVLIRHVAGLEVVKATFINYTLPLHLHEKYAVATVEKGVEEFYYHGPTYNAIAGDISLINPYEVHSGGSAKKKIVTYRGLYPTTLFLSDLLFDLELSGCEIPYFPSPVVHDKSLAKSILQLHHLLERAPNSLQAQSMMVWIFSQLIIRYAEKTFKIKAIGNEKAAVKLAKKYILENYSQHIQLNELSKICGLSPFYLLRCFCKEIGMPPHQFLINVRIERAKDFILAGKPFAWVAYETGFSDQSHLTRTFRSIVGVTPGKIFM